MEHGFDADEEMRLVARKSRDNPIYCRPSRNVKEQTREAVAGSSA